MFGAIVEHRVELALEAPITHGLTVGLAVEPHVDSHVDSPGHEDGIPRTRVDDIGDTTPTQDTWYGLMAH